MKIRKLIEMHLRRQRDGVGLASDVNVAIAANVEERTSAGTAGAQTHWDREPEQTINVPKGETDARGISDANA